MYINNSLLSAWHRRMPSTILLQTICVDEFQRLTTDAWSLTAQVFHAELPVRLMSRTKKCRELWADTVQLQLLEKALAFSPLKLKEVLGGAQVFRLSEQINT